MDLLWTDFLNSEWHDWRGSGRSEDRLDRPGWLGEFLAQWGLPAPGEANPEAVAALKELRRFLQHMARIMAAGEAPGTDDVAALNEVLAGGPVVRQLTHEHRLNQAPVGQSWAQVHAEIAASLAQTLAEGGGGRVRICENPDCLWFFYDDTRNRTKRFCDDKLCGNLMKVRRFRARKRTE